MQPELSRRAAKVHNLTLEERLKFVEALEKVDTFDQLPKQYQELIVSAERQPAERRKETNWVARWKEQRKMKRMHKD